MNVSQLRELLQDLETEGYGDTEVVTSYNYGDYWKTQVADSISGASNGHVEYSDYHRMDKIVDADEVEEEDEDGNFTQKPNLREVIVLN